MKNKLSYPALLTPDLEEGGFVVTFPDLPEAITQGDTLEQAQQAASDCLEEAIVGRMRLNKLLPQPSNLKKGQYLIDLPKLIHNHADYYCFTSAHYYYLCPPMVG